MKVGNAYGTYQSHGNKMFQILNRYFWEDWQVLDQSTTNGNVHRVLPFSP